MASNIIGTFTWENGSATANDYMVKFLKSNGIKFYFDFGRLYAVINSNPVQVSRQHIDGDLFAIVTE